MLSECVKIIDHVVLLFWELRKTDFSHTAGGCLGTGGCMFIHKCMRK